MCFVPDPLTPPSDGRVKLFVTTELLGLGVVGVGAALDPVGQTGVDGDYVPHSHVRVWTEGY